MTTTDRERWEFCKARAGSTRERKRSLARKARAAELATRAGERRTRGATAEGGAAKDATRRWAATTCALALTLSHTPPCQLQTIARQLQLLPRPLIATEVVLVKVATRLHHVQQHCIRRLRHGQQKIYQASRSPKSCQAPPNLLKPTELGTGCNRYRPQHLFLRHLEYRVLGYQLECWTTRPALGQLPKAGCWVSGSAARVKKVFTRTHGQILRKEK
jgi:hypothetical protein